MQQVWQVVSAKAIFHNTSTLWWEIGTRVRHPSSPSIRLVEQATKQVRRRAQACCLFQLMPSQLWCFCFPSRCGVCPPAQPACQSVAWHYLPSLRWAHGAVCLPQPHLSTLSANWVTELGANQCHASTPWTFVFFFKPFTDKIINYITIFRLEHGNLKHGRRVSHKKEEKKLEQSLSSQKKEKKMKERKIK